MDAVALKNQLNTHVAYMFSAVSFHAQPSPRPLSGGIGTVFYGGIVADRGGPGAGG
jgi:hypothetical protein